MSHILIVGQKLSALTEYLKEHNHTFTFLQDKNKTKFPEKHFKNRVLADFTSREKLLDTIDALPKKVDGAITTYENYVLPTAWITEYLGIPGLPVSAAEACTDKFLMRSLFAQAPEKISPAFATVKTRSDVEQFAEQHGYPLILKPANLAKSLLVTKNNSLDELLANYDKAVKLLETTYKKYAPNRQPSLIIEEFLEGSIHSVDAFIDNSGTPYVLNNVVDYQTGYDIGFEDNFHYSRILPSALSLSDQDALRHCAEVGVRSLGMKSSPAHIEIIMTKEGPRIVEIGARSGGYRERMHGLANGIDITKNTIAVSTNASLELEAVRNDPCAVLELFPKIPGTFIEISSETELRELPSLVYVSTKAVRGNYVGKAADGYKMCAVIILHNSDSSQFAKDLDFVNTKVHVVTRQDS